MEHSILGGVLGNSKLSTTSHTSWERWTVGWGVARREPSETEPVNGDDGKRGLVYYLIWI